MQQLYGTLSDSLSTIYPNYPDLTEWPLLICVLGQFRLLKRGLPSVRYGGPKAQALLTSLALQRDNCMPQDILLHTLWPGREESLAHQSLNTLIHTIKDQLSDTLDDKSPILFEEGVYRLNLQAGVGVDLTYFQALVHLGDQAYHSSNYTSALSYYTRASELYKVEPCQPTMPVVPVSATTSKSTSVSAVVGMTGMTVMTGMTGATSSDSQLAIRHGYIRGVYLTLLIRLAVCYYTENDYDASLEMAFRLLTNDPHREDAHRVVMRSYVGLGQRAQALHHFSLCKQVLQSDLGIEPEPSTMALFNQIKFASDSA